MINKEYIDSICNQYLNEYAALDDGEDRLFYRLYHTNVREFALGMSKKGQVYIWNRAEDGQSEDEDDYILDTTKFIDGILSDPNIYTKTYVNTNGGIRYMCFGDNFMINTGRLAEGLNYFTVFASDRQHLLSLTNYIYKREPEKKYFFINVDSRGSCYTTSFEVNRNNDTSLDNYNDDIPYEELKGFCESDETGIALLYGEPGCGKSTLIKKLITNASKNFYLLNTNTLDYTASLTDFLIDHRDCVIVIEDCEKLLRSRESGNNNPWISTLLNMSDGILGDSLKLKFICTFNTELGQIDKALLRKGRLKIKYEFKKLKYEKAKKIGDKFGIKVTSDMSLADLYNSNTEVDFSKKKSTKIGFK